VRLIPRLTEFVAARNSRTTVCYDWIGLRLGSQGLGQSIWIDLRTTRLYGRFTDTSWILRISFFFAGLFGCCFCFAYCNRIRYSFACTLALLYCLDDRAHRRHTIISLHNSTSVISLSYLTLVIIDLSYCTTYCSSKLFFFNFLLKSFVNASSFPFKRLFKVFLLNFRSWLLRFGTVQ
jgi:hypothetical protein